jgi:hypothetical protein
VSLRGGADKFLAQPGRKQATASKRGIYSTYHQRSSTHFLARCSNVCKPFKKIQKFVHPIRSPRQQLFFSLQGTGGSRMGQIWRIGWVINILETQVGQFLLGCKLAVRRGVVVQEQDPPFVTFPRGFYFKMPFNCISKGE